MSWKVFAVFVKPHGDLDHEHILKELGYNKLEKGEPEVADEAIYPDDDTVYIGTYNDSLVICSQGLPEDFIAKEELSVTEEKFIELFPNSEIFATILHGTTNAYGYALIKDGKKIRLKAGHAEEAVVIEVGDPLEEENEILEYATTDENGDKVFKFSEDEDPYPEHAVGEEFVFKVLKRFLGEPLDEATEFLENTKLQAYTIDVSLDEDAELEAQTSDDFEAENQEREPAKINWPMLILIFIVVAAIFGVLMFF